MLSAKPGQKFMSISPRRTERKEKHMDGTDIHASPVPDTRVFGKYRGTVVDSDDPQAQGRITAIVPELFGEVPTGWALPCTPMAGVNAGFFSIPAPASGVWIEFEAGDVDRPVWTGGYWAVGEAPMTPPSTPSKWTRKTWRSVTGLTITLDDTAQKVTVADSTAQNMLEINAATGTLTIKGLSSVVADAQTVQLGSAAARHPSVYGDDLLIYLSQLVAIFNSHVHPGEMALGVLPVTPAPPVAPMTPPSPSLLSRKVFDE
jgi:uncharacterized protein involved in type VI secretion and phage assembly